MPTKIALTLSCLAAVSLGTAQAGAAPTNALTTAKTIQCRETFQTAVSIGQPLKPSAAVLVQISRPDNVKVVLTPLDSKGKVFYYVVNGTAEHEYNGYSNTYRLLDATPEAHAHDQFRGLAAVDLILKPDPQGTPDATTQRTVSQVLLNGRPMILRTDILPSIKSKGGLIASAQKIWFDARTGLPVRRSDVMTQNGKESTVTQLDFSEWQINKSIAPAAFAFRPPAGSKEQITPKLLAVGTPAPDFAAMTPDGKTVHLSDYKGKAVVLDFWATWCGPCQESMPHLEKVYQQIKDKDVTVLALCVWDEKDAYSKWVKENIGTKYTFPVAFDAFTQEDPQNVAGGLYHVSGIPTQYIIDKNGNVAATTVGYGDGDHELEKALRGLGVTVAETPGS